MSEEYITPDEIAERFRVSRQAVYKWISEGKLEGLRFGRSVRVPRESLERFVEASRMSSETSKAAGRASVQAA